MDFREYIEETLWGRLGLLCTGVVFFLSIAMVCGVAYMNRGIDSHLFVLLLIAPTVIYNIITGVSATLLWLISKDWGGN